MNNNTQLIQKSTNVIEKASFDLLKATKDGDVDIHSSIYKINQEAHKIKILLRNCLIK